MFKGEFDSMTPTVTVNVPISSAGSPENIAVSVIHPIILLNIKCAVVFERAEAIKKTTDYEDIVFLLRYIARASIPLSAAQVPNATGAGAYLANVYGEKDAWIAAGYNFETGE